MIRSKLRDITIRWKLILIIMSTCVSVLALSGAAFIVSERTIVRHFMARNLLTQAEIVADNCKAALVFKEAKDAEEILKALQAESSIVSACIYTNSGEPFAGYYRDGADRSPPPSGLKEDGHFFNEGLLIAFKTVVLDGEIIGRVCLRSDLSPMRKMFKFHTWITTAVILFASLTALLLSSVLQGIISKPILSLTDTARIVSEKGDYSTRALKQTNDEIGLLIDAFNTMLEQIQKRDMELVERADELTAINEQLGKEVAERVKAEAQVRQKNEFLNTVLESLTHPFCVIDANDYTVKMANSAAKRTYPDTLSDGITCYMLSHLRDKPCDTIEDTCPIEEIKRTGKPAVVEHVHYDGDRNPMFVEVHAYPIFGSDGKLSEIIEYSLDITERKRAEEALYASHQIIEGVINAISVRVFWKDKNLVYLGCNAIFARDAGFTDPKDLVGKDDYQMGWRDQAERYRSDDRQVIESGRPKLLIEEPQTTPEGKTITLLTSKIPLCDSKGEIIGVIGTYMDITPRKQAEETLRKSENKYRTLIENLPQRVFSKDRNSVYVSCNENFARDVGIRPEEFKGKTDYDFFPRELAEKYRQDDKRVMETGKTENIEEKYVRKGQEMIVQTVKTPIKDGQGNISGVLGIFWDITDLKRAQEELRRTHEKLLEASRMAGMAEVAADVLHNVGNVLNSINVSATLITGKVSNSEVANLEKVARIINEHIDEIGTFLTEHPQGKHIPVYLTEVSKCLQAEQTDIISKLQVLTDNVQHIKDVISMQQAYAKISGVEVQVSPTRLVEDAIQINSAGLQRHGTRLVREFEELPDVEVDKQRALQILVNLISNAKYALSDSKKREKLVTIRIYKHKEDRFRIEVADNGVGIPQENLTKIFSHGFTTKQGGHGFGLHSSALAANEMGGSLTVYSGGLEQGATFTLELPFKPVKVTS